MTTSFPRLFPVDPPGKLHAVESDHALTLLIPAYNEEKRLPLTLTAAKLFLDDWGIDYRVVVIDNGSKDKTGELTSDMGPRFSTITQPVSGKGAAVRKGMLLATGSVIAFTDADLPYELQALRQGFERVRSGQSDVVFGSRSVEGAAVAVKRRLLRTMASYVFQSIVKRLISKTVVDTQCGLKIFSRAAANAVFSRATIDGFAFDAEVVFLTRRLHLTQSCVPVTLINEDGSTLSLSRHALPMLRDVMKVRWQEWNGTYQWDSAVPSVPETVESPRRAA